MAINPMDVVSHADFIPELWAAKALGAFHQNCQMPRLVNRDWENEVAEFGDTINVPKYGSFTAYDKTPGSDVNVQDPGGSKVQIVLSYHKEVSFLVEDPLRAQSKPELFTGYVNQAGIALANAMDLILLASYASATYSVGNASTAINEDNILEARKLLNYSEIPYNDRYFVCRDFKPLLKIDRFTRARDYGQDTVIPTGLVGDIHGAQCFEDPRIIEVAGSPATLHNLYFWKGAATLACRPLPPADPGTGAISGTIVMDNISFRVTKSYQGLKLGHLITVDVLFGVKVVWPQAIVDFISSSI